MDVFISNSESSIALLVDPVCQSTDEIRDVTTTGHISDTTSYISSFFRASSAAFFTSDEAYAMPAVQDLSINDTEFLTNHSTQVPAWYTSSGHIVVKASINENDNFGYFILDTGASGFVIEPSVADSLELSAFGELYITGVSGKCKGKFRQAGTFQIGPLLIRNPIMMEMTCSGLTSGAPGPVIGIIGHDVFHRAIVDIPSAPKKAIAEDSSISSPAAAFASFMPMQKKKTGDKNSCFVHVYHPDSIEEVEEELRQNISEANDKNVEWLPITMLSSIPHIDTRVLADRKNGSNDMKNTSALLMVDTGAGGMDAIINARSAEELQLLRAENGKKKGSRSIRGVGGSQTSSIRLDSIQLECLKVGNVEFENVSCLIAEDGAGGGVELSYYTSGILCAGLLAQCRLVVDLQRNRIAIFK